MSGSAPVFSDGQPLGLLEAALMYASFGWSVVPVSRPLPDQPCSCDKETREANPRAHGGPAGLHVGCSVCGVCDAPGEHPVAALAPDGARDATTDTDTIRSWWGDDAEHNIGIATGRGSLDVLAVDRGVPDHVRTAMPGRLGPITATAPSDHYYFQHQPVGTRPPDKVAFGEWKSDGGMVVAPPSLHPSGQRYEWLGGHGPGQPLPSLPKDLREALVKARFDPSEQQRRRQELDGGELLETALGALGAGGLPHRQVGDLAYRARCPVHAPIEEEGHSRTSLSLRVADGRLLVHCFAGCAYRDVAAALGIDDQRRLGDDPQVRIGAVPEEDARIGPLLDAILELLTKYMALPVEYAHTVALWIAMTHVFQHCGYAARLRLRSAVYRSGKSRLLELIAPLVPNGRITTHVTQSVFRQLDGVLLLDEMDMWYHPEKHGELTAMLNDGYRAGATITVNVKGPDGTWVPEEFSVYRPVAFAANESAHIPAPLADRCLTLLLRRKGVSEATARLKGRKYALEAAPLYDRLAAWGQRNGDRIAALLDAAEDEYVMPLDGNDRAVDIWEPLAVIAELAGGPWPQQCRNAARLLAQEAAQLSTSADGPAAELLADVRGVFAAKGDPEGLPVREVLAELHSLEDGPYLTWDRNGKPLSTTAMAKLLKPFRVVSDRRPLRAGEPGYDPKSTKRTPMAYELADVVDAFRRLNPAGDSAIGQGDTPGSPTLSPPEDVSDQGFCASPDRGDRVTGHAAHPGADLCEVLAEGPKPLAEVTALTGLSACDVQARVASGELVLLGNHHVQLGEPL